MGKTNDDRWKILPSFLTNLPEYLIYAGAIALIVDEFLQSILNIDLLLNDDLKFAIMVFLILMFVNVTNRKLDILKRDTS